MDILTTEGGESHMAKHGKKRQSALHGRDWNCRPVVELLEQRNPPGKLALLDFGIADLSTLQANSAFAALTKGSTGSNSTSAPTIVPTNSQPTGSVSYFSNPPPVSGAASVNSSGANTPPPSPGTGGSAFDNLVNSSNSHSSGSSAASFLAMMNSTSHASSSSGFGSFSSSGSLSPVPGSGGL